jgi:hypothetical protein
VSVDSLMSVHKIDVLLQTTAQGPSMGAHRTFGVVPARTLSCRVIPGEASDPVFLGLRGVQAAFEIRFPGDPGFSVSSRLRWAGPAWSPLPAPVILRVVSVPRDQHGLGYFWIVKAAQLLADNPTAQTAPPPPQPPYPPPGAGGQGGWTPVGPVEAF